MVPRGMAGWQSGESSALLKIKIKCEAGFAPTLTAYRREKRRRERGIGSSSQRHHFGRARLFLALLSQSRDKWREHAATSDPSAPGQCIWLLISITNIDTNKMGNDKARHCRGGDGGVTGLIEKLGTLNGGICSSSPSNNAHEEEYETSRKH